ncbi:MAG: response regulator [Oligoflexales bacterium]|nr:response regulator [Oligoflexales bacterium]
MSPQDSSSQHGATLPKKILVIDDDESIGILVKQILEESGIPTVEAFDQSSSAWDSAQRETYDFIIMDWKMPEISGPALLNRFRHHPFYYKVPIIVSSGFLGKEDLVLLGEFFLVGKFEKPVQKGSFIRKVAELYAEFNWFDSKEKQLTEILSQMKNEIDSSNLIKTFETILSEAKKPLPIGISAARILMAEKKYKDAEHILMFILDKFPDSIFALQELGKLHLINKSYDAAKRALMGAFKKSPKNLERLNLLGNVSMQTMELEEAGQYFSKALELDPMSKMAHKGNKVIENISTFMSQSDLEGIPHSFASMLNAVGISFVKNQDFDKGVEHYKSALPYVQDEDLKAKILFNIALAFIRSKKPKEALPWLQKSAGLSVQFAKAKELLPKVEEIVKKIKEKPVKKDLTDQYDPDSPSDTEFPIHDDMSGLEPSFEDDLLSHNDLASDDNDEYFPSGKNPII